MAVVIRCSPCFCAPQDSLHSTPSDAIIIPTKSHLPGNLAPLLFRVGKFASMSGCASSVPSTFCHKLPDSRSLCLGTMLKSCSDAFQVPAAVYEKFSEPLSAHQPLQGKAKVRDSAIAFLVSNALVWTAPFAALAETCEADNSIFNMPLLLFVALIGATVGGLLARQRRRELQRLNEQLRQINAALRRQAKIESYAPSLSYAPVGSRIQENEIIVDPRKEELICTLKSGKNFLRNQDLENAFLEFKKALELAQDLKDPIEEKKAARGLGASLQRQGKYREAIKYHSMVLAISEQQGEDSGNTEAYGAIADCHTELGDLERAGKFYDEYIARLERD